MRKCQCVGEKKKIVWYWILKHSNLKNKADYFAKFSPIADYFFKVTLDINEGPQCSIAATFLNILIVLRSVIARLHSQQRVGEGVI